MHAILETERLLLRPPDAADISHFLPLVGDFDVTKNLSVVPHPYTEDDACAFITWAANGWASGEDLVFAIVRKSDGAYLGGCGVHPNRHWEIGYWLGKPYWGKGYATETAKRLVVFGFEELRAESLSSGWFHDNLASGRVLQKAGFRPVGQEMRNCLARGAKVPCHVVALDRADYMTRKKAS